LRRWWWAIARTRLLRERDGWQVVEVRAASINHHDLWTLRGVGIAAEHFPMILGCDAAGTDEHGTAVLVHSVIGDPGPGGDETLNPRRTLLSERHQGTFAERVAVPSRNLVPLPKAGRQPRRLVCRLPG
jgi:NADPH:quinone reductase-like Zn-dependent oxidoreductase